MASGPAIRQRLKAPCAETAARGSQTSDKFLIKSRKSAAFAEAAGGPHEFCLTLELR